MDEDSDSKFNRKSDFKMGEVQSEIRRGNQKSEAQSPIALLLQSQIASSCSIRYANHLHLPRISSIRISRISSIRTPRKKERWNENVGIR
ncbi:hypothetical protein E3N88_04924 [Mikania micrantha]|uniref:Uncharacterized protein n=1 Tax=Mikania micrantha TaxID=192012 RepID=A0A5N6PXM6_9ASTR|nr:hypothetical protein E3N88_04924 [Mikania micrantha]